ncbi:MAG: hypothetical protein ACYCYF_08820 [Anaerolineae bacterium]
MALRYQNLDDQTRVYMLAEYDRDSADGRLYVCKRLKDAGRRHFPALLRRAIEQHDDHWLAEQLHELLLLTTFSGTGGPAVGTQVAEAIAEAEFNRYYMRGLCARAVAEGIEQVQVYRAKVVATRNAQTLEHIGQSLSASALLAEFRNAHETDPALASPFGDATGLSMRFV